jgi:hypothetical protein
VNLPPPEPCFNPTFKPLSHIPFFGALEDYRIQKIHRIAGKITLHNHVEETGSLVQAILQAHSGASDSTFNTRIELLRASDLLLMMLKKTRTHSLSTACL